jgi:predicted transcriptional regulator
MKKIEKLIITTLEEAEKSLTLAEIAMKIGQPDKKVFKSLRKLFEKGIVNSQNRRYKLTEG